MNKSKVKTLGICVSRLFLENQTKLVQVLCKIADEKNIRLFIFNTFGYSYESSFEAESKIFDSINFETLDGLILHPDYIRSDAVIGELAAKAKAVNIPVLIIDGVCEGCYNLNFDYLTAFESNVRHIFEFHGCRNVSFIASFKGNKYSEARLDCYRKLLAENGITYDKSKVYYGDWEEALTYKLVDRLMKKPLPEAIICANDEMALAACDALHKYGVNVPEDVLVTGFDGSPLNEFFTPKLTTSVLDWDKIGEKIIDIFCRIFSGEHPEKDNLVAYEPCIGQSCGCRPLVITDTNYKTFELSRRNKDKTKFNDKMFELTYRTASINSYSDFFTEMKKYLFFVNTLSFACYVEPGFLKYNRIAADVFKTAIESDVDDNKEIMTGLFVFNRGVISESVTFEKELMIYNAEVINIQPLSDCGHLFFFPILCDGEYDGYTVIEFDVLNTSFDDVFDFIVSFNGNLGFVKAKIDIIKASRQLEYLFMHNSMTGLYNRRGFYMTVEGLIKLHEDECILISSIDMDGLKRINDTFGHFAGDDAIKTVAKAIQYATNGYISVNARFGGDEFMSVTFTDSPETVMIDISDKFANYLHDYNSSSGNEYLVEASFGFVLKELRNVSCGIDDLIAQADDAMYSEKQKKLHIRTHVRV